ncbi:hypothetical protein ABVT39_014726 [Epinephelus coioides]
MTRLNAGSKPQHGRRSLSTSMPADSRRGQGFGEVVVQLRDTWKTMHELQHREGERAGVELCGGMYSEERRKNGEELCLRID